MFKNYKIKVMNNTKWKDLKQWKQTQYSKKRLLYFVLS
jgi:hypothetical protein